MLGPTPAIHPGEILRMEFRVPLNLSAYTVAELVPKNWTDGLALDLISNPRERIRRR